VIRSLTEPTLLFLSILFVFGCGPRNTETDERVAAKVGDKTLFAEDVESAMPDNLTVEDSLNMAQSFIRNWVTQNLLLEKAELNLSGDQLDVSEKLEEYRQSLLIYLYQKEYVRQQMDTAVSGSELLEYYDANKENFKLKDNIARMLFVRLASNNKDVSKVMKWCRSDKEEDREELNAYCQQHAIKFILMEDRWNVFNEVISEVPQDLYSSSNSLFRTGTIELSDTTGTYILSIKEVKSKNEVAPLEFEASSIQGIILNKRKIDLVKSLEQQIFDEGLSKNHVRID
jgi:hypothetical protein